jgi:hypothetical protein
MLSVYYLFIYFAAYLTMPPIYLSIQCQMGILAKDELERIWMEVVMA